MHISPGASGVMKPPLRVCRDKGNDFTRDRTPAGRFGSAPSAVPDLKSGNWPPKKLGSSGSRDGMTVEQQNANAVLGVDAFNFNSKA